ncbi:MAG: excinuclease ABC subunit UvrC [Desulfovibrio sp.]|nr:excinuclease ABC subunit UvrC [Desulfovibrio sp.]
MDRPDPATIPSSPGVYLYHALDKSVLYVGKARNLRKRVLSYFRKDGLSAKTQAMLAKATHISFLTTTTEKEALLLEANLIKKHRPHYNIALRDDKQYFLFRLDSQKPYPRLEIVRQAKNDGARYFGPFTQALAARDTWKLLHTSLGLRRCTDRALSNRVRPCLYYHMHQCLAPCTGTLSHERYQQAVDTVIQILEGKADDVIFDLTRKMTEAADNLAYEEAARYRDQIQAIQKTIELQAVFLPGKADTDVVGLAQTEKGIALAIVCVRNAAIAESNLLYFPSLDENQADELILTSLSQYYATIPPPPKILLPWMPQKSLDSAQEIEQLTSALSEMRGSPVAITLATSAVDQQLLAIAAGNAKEKALVEEKAQTNHILVLLQKALHLPNLPVRIESVDVSHTQGAQTRVGMVVYTNAQPAPSLYRVYTMPDCQDDYQTLAEWVPRRLQSGPPWPDLLLIDGGRGQVAAVAQAFKNAKSPQPIPLAGIAKARNKEGNADRRFGNVNDRIFLENRANPLPIKAGSREMLFLQQIRNATHHFAITKHRQARTKKSLESTLEQLPGIGHATAQRLWQHFPDLTAMLNADWQTIAAIPGIGEKRAQTISASLAALKKKE